jgi:hypothetical protein
LLVCIAAYGLLAPSLGYYWDGWPLAWIADAYGPDGLAQYFSTNRPVWGWLYRLTTPLVGGDPLAWQVFGILTRWLSGLAFWALLKRLWPQRDDVAAWAALLFTLYPGFRQYPIANMYGHFYIVLALALVSLWLHLGVARGQARFWSAYLPALGLATYSLFATEYFFGLELLRPVLLFLVLPSAPLRERLMRALRLWWPFGLLIPPYAYWRVYILGFHTYDPAAIVSGGPPAQAALNLLGRAAQGIFTSGLAAWAAPVQHMLAADPYSRLTWLAVLLVPGIGLGLFLAMRSDSGDRQSGLIGAAVGLLALALSILPVLVTGLPIRFDFPSDRLTLPMMAGSALLIVGIGQALFRRAALRRAAYALLAGLAVASQFLIGVAYRQDWRYQASFFQQLDWRAPSVEPGTIFVMHELEGLHLTDNSLVGPLNALYAPGEANAPIRYYAAYFPLRNQPGSFLARLEPGRPVTNDYLVARFEGSTDQLLVVLFQPPACLRVLHPVYDAHYPQLPDDLRTALALSNPDELIAPAGAANPALLNLFSARPSPDSWCSHFQQADLARQRGDWAAVAALGDVAFALDDSPNHASERVPFIEGYAMTGRWGRAEALTRETLDINPLMAPMLCAVWQRVAENASAPDATAIAGMLALVCE